MIAVTRSLALPQQPEAQAGSALTGLPQPLHQWPAGGPTVGATKKKSYRSDGLSSDS